MDTLNDFLAWVWARHHNILSWYVRPIFILPFCFFAYRRSWKGLIATLLLLPTSLFWFPAPATPDPQVLAYLQWEKDFLTSGNPLLQLLFVVLVIAFFAGLAAAFWKRNWIYGLAVLNFGTLLKIVWSIGFAGEVGLASVLPSIVTLAICNSAFFAARLFIQRRQTRAIKT
jgi:hypothetical protein